MNNMIPGTKKSYNVYAYWHFGIPSSFENTLAILKETGYPLTVDEVKINEIRLIWYKDLEDDQPEELIYEDKKEIEELKSALTYDTNGGLYTAGKVYPMIIVEVETDHGSEKMSMELLKEEAPEFVKTQLEELGVS